MIKIVMPLIFSLFLSTSLFAEEKSPWSHESEASVVSVDGNTTSDSYSAKQKTSYKFDTNVLKVTARYLRTKSDSTETARQWEASLRYEKEFSDLWSAFIQHGAESDSYAGYTQRDSTDIGGKYFFVKTDDKNFFSEAGLRYQKTLSSSDGETTNSTMGRLYLEYNEKFSETVSGKMWVEYLPNFSDSYAYLLNGEPSVSVMMNQIFSLKVAYLVKYHNLISSSTEKRTDTMFTTALVAKF
ncbi:MAG: DUF481 domain-containing protein [Bdellovibrionales bacterium]|nr:DUF481 domain-containing protein [Bdellovibrionales bacterium]